MIAMMHEVVRLLTALLEETRATRMAVRDLVEALDREAKREADLADFMKTVLSDVPNPHNTDPPVYIPHEER